MNYKIFDIIKNDKTYLEKEPFEILSKKLLNAFKHNGFWQCMDTLRDKELLEKVFQEPENQILKKILIIGGTGFIGYHVANKALKKNGK